MKVMFVGVVIVIVGVMTSQTSLALIRMRMGVTIGLSSGALNVINFVCRRCGKQDTCVEESIKSEVLICDECFFDVKVDINSYWDRRFSN
jgi:hypothetical protein